MSYLIERLNRHISRGKLSEMEENTSLQLEIFFYKGYIIDMRVSKQVNVAKAVAIQHI